MVRAEESLERFSWRRWIIRRMTLVGEEIVRGGVVTVRLSFVMGLRRRLPSKGNFLDAREEE